MSEFDDIQEEHDKQKEQVKEHSETTINPPTKRNGINQWDDLVDILKRKRWTKTEFSEMKRIWQNSLAREINQLPPLTEKQIKEVLMPTVTEDKKWYQSKILWVNLLVIMAVMTERIYGFNLTGEDQLGILAVVNLILRLITNQGLKK